MGQLMKNDVGSSAIQRLPGRPPFMLDRDVAQAYGVTTKELNQARKNNPRKFVEGEDFFRLTEKEVKNFDLSAKTVTYLPFGYCRKGVRMFATILKTDEAIDQAIVLVEGFDLVERLAESGQLAKLQPKVVEVVPTVTVNALEQAQRDAEFWKLKYQLEQKTQECEQLKQHKKKRGKAKGWNSFTMVEEAEVVACYRAGLQYAEIGERMKRTRSGAAIRAKVRRLKALGKL